MRSGRDLGRLVGAWHRPCKEQCALVADYDQRSVDVCLPSPPLSLGQIMAQCRLKPIRRVRNTIRHHGHTTCAALLIQSSESAYISRASGLGPGVSKTETRTNEKARGVGQGIGLQGEPTSEFSASEEATCCSS